MSRRFRTAAVECLESRRLLAGFSLDASFGQGGVIEVPPNGGFGIIANALLEELPDGRLVTGGNDRIQQGLSGFAYTVDPLTSNRKAAGVTTEYGVRIAGLEFDGSRVLGVRFYSDSEAEPNIDELVFTDPITFNGTTTVNLPFETPVGVDVRQVGTHDVDALPGGGFLIRVNVVRDNPSRTTYPQWVKVDGAGVLDSSWADDGILELPLSFDASETYATTAGPILVNNASLTRYTNAGVVDTGFTPINLPGFAGLVEQPDGKLVVFQHADAGVQLTRLNADGTRDTTYADPLIEGELARYAAADVGVDGTLVVATNFDLYSFDTAGNPAGPFEEPLLQSSSYGIGQVLIDTQGRVVVGSTTEIRRYAEAPPLIIGIDRTLNLTGSGDGDNISIVRTGATYTIDLNGDVAELPIDDFDHVRIDVSSAPGSTAGATVSAVIDRDITVVGSDGDDTIATGSGSDWIYDTRGSLTADVGSGDARFKTQRTGTPRPGETLTARGIGGDYVEITGNFAGGHSIDFDAGGFFLDFRGGAIDRINLGEVRDQRINLGINGTDVGINIGAGGSGSFSFDVIADVFDISTGDGADRITAVGSGVIRTNGGNDIVTVYGGSDARPLELFGGDGDDYLLVEGDYAATLHGEDGRDALFAGDGRQTLYGGAQPDTLRGGAGSDLLSGNGGHDLIFGHTGKDRLYGGDGRDTLNAGSGDDRLFGENDDDTLIGSYGNDQLVGGPGSDYLDAGRGDDTLFASDTLIDTLFGGGGNDTADRDDADLIDGIEILNA